MADETQIPLWVDALKDLITTGVAAFIGAWFAFRLERSAKGDDEQEQNYRSLLAAQFALLTHANSLLNIKTRYLDPARNQPDRFIRLPPLIHQSSVTPVDTSALLFLLHGPDPQLLGELSITDAKYETVVNALSQRNSIHHLAQKETEESGKAGPRLSTQLQQLTDKLYEVVDEAYTHTQNINEKVRLLMTKMFPGRNAITMTQ